MKSYISLEQIPFSSSWNNPWSKEKLLQESKPGPRAKRIPWSSPNSFGGTVTLTLCDCCTVRAWSLQACTENYLSGWWFEPLWILVGMMIPKIWKNKVHVPNHQPAMVIRYSNHKPSSRECHPADRSPTRPPGEASFSSSSSVEGQSLSCSASSLAIWSFAMGCQPAMAHVQKHGWNMMNSSEVGIWWNLAAKTGENDENGDVQFLQDLSSTRSQAFK